MNAALWMGMSAGLMTAAVFLCGMEIRGSHGFTCDCRALPYWPHLDSVWLFLAGTISVAHAVVAFTSGFFPVQVLAFGLVYMGYWRFTLWWRHTRGSRRRLWGRILGVVTVTAAGLRIKPIPA